VKRHYYALAAHQKQLAIAEAARQSAESKSASEAEAAAAKYKRAADEEHAEYLKELNAVSRSMFARSHILTAASIY